MAEERNYEGLVLRRVKDIRINRLTGLYTDADLVFERFDPLSRSYITQRPEVVTLSLSEITGESEKLDAKIHEILNSWEHRNLINSDDELGKALQQYRAIQEVLDQVPQTLITLQRGKLFGRRISFY